MTQSAAGSIVAHSVYLVVLGVIGLIATASLFAPLPIGCAGLPIYFGSLVAIVVVAGSMTYATFQHKSSLRRLFLITYLWACVFAMVPFFPFAVHAVEWLMTR